VDAIAVIADPHFHDTDCRQGRCTGPLAAVRTLADTMESTRVFNEAFAALPAMLEDIVRRDIRLVVIAGDLSDDGQRSTLAAAAAMLEHYSARHGLRFFATPGNHDLYAVHGRHQGKRFLNSDGSHTLVTSDPNAETGNSASIIVAEDMYCGGYAETLSAMAPFGFFRRADFLHWETPFGTEDDLEKRSFEIASADGRTRRRIVDASYLVEPVEGTWLLSVDANVFEPRNGDLDPILEASWIDSTDAGWNSMLRHKPFILDWMTSVAARAARLGKRLLVFSHYPVTDPLGGTASEEAGLLGDTNFVRRTPDPAVAEAVAGTGIKVHFSGHLHINDTAVFRTEENFLVNVAVPSAVGFPAAYKIVWLDAQQMRVETVPIAHVPGYDRAFGLYRAEVARQTVTPGGLLEAVNHIEFLSQHLGALVADRYLSREWPADLARLVSLLTLADLWSIAAVAAPLQPRDAAPGAFPGLAPEEMGRMTFFDMVVDWYRLRKGRHLALDHIAADRLAVYRTLARRYSDGSFDRGSLQERLASFFRIMDAYLASEPSRHFSIALLDGTVREQAALALA
jgi:3',5'-cyclic AMP phosphodiesterase CpdA